MSPVLIGFLGSLAAGLMTGLGALPVLFGRSVSKRTNDVLLGFAAGVMLSASFLSLILPGIDSATDLYGSRLLAAGIAAVGILAGAGCMAVLNEVVPHEHFVQGRQGPEARELARIWLFVFAITLHNLPEGLAVGVGFGANGFTAGLPLAIGIGLQNAPEGLAVALTLLATGYPRGKAVRVATLTGLVEPVTGLVGAAAVSLSTLVLPWALTFAAGAMLYVISHEIIPETHRHGYEKEATLGITVGLVLMMVLDVAFA
ncbi:ZIP family metal transporter [Polymorphum gilvum]|uniref:Zinc (Zn2+)-iron permease family metal cation transporter n=1 Tax=Polymorphum gilvum (strain LMG 25793 / CGMCC 1.9160 / SL003B-26A1) TaxID=991905 RepID=F2IXU3_POLGS|nr:ZIP family metal transporter [Polymorphum gilvum]ADZ69424.1 Zinc (Zn2+)-iron permease family metal cation transporter [Polymorphum gilvum SL003B-26A1]